jgi:hypothetical protein
MNSTFLIENTTSLSITESWDRTCTLINDRPLSAAYWNLAKMTGEDLLDELPSLLVDPTRIMRSRN